MIREAHKQFLISPSEVVSVSFQNTSSVIVIFVILFKQMIIIQSFNWPLFFFLAPDDAWGWSLRGAPPLDDPPLPLTTSASKPRCSFKGSSCELVAGLFWFPVLHSDMGTTPYTYTSMTGTPMPDKNYIFIVKTAMVAQLML